MRLSDLQKYILVELFQQNIKRYPRARLPQYYARFSEGSRPHQSLQVKIITRSIERMIDKELLIGFGMRTPHKWFIREVQLTSKGRKLAHEIFVRRQQSLPFKKRSKLID